VATWNGVRSGLTRFAPKKEEIYGRVTAETAGVVLAAMFGSLAMAESDGLRTGGAAVSSLAKD
jgi:hypothetical protein